MFELTNAVNTTICAKIEKIKYQRKWNIKSEPYLWKVPKHEKYLL